MVTSENKTEESDTPVEENKEAMLPEDGILWTYVEKQSETDKKTDTAVGGLLGPQTVRVSGTAETE